MTREYIDGYLGETEKIIGLLDREAIEVAVGLLRQTRKAGARLFIIGVGGSASNASHAVNDFRKICSMEAYTPADNVSELTARTNDDGFETIFDSWLATSHLREGDCLMVLSVGGGTKTISNNLVRAMEFAKLRKAWIVSIVSRDGGAAKKMSDACILVPVVAEERITPHAEGFQSVICHLLVNALDAT